VRTSRSSCARCIECWEL